MIVKKNFVFIFSTRNRQKSFSQSHFSSSAIDTIYKLLLWFRHEKKGGQLRVLKPAEAFWAVVLVISVRTGFILYEALVLHFIWKWFIVPLGVREISLAHSVGIMCFGSFFRAKIKERAKSSDWMTIFGPLLILLIGWIAKQFLTY